MRQNGLQPHIRDLRAAERQRTKLCQLMGLKELKGLEILYLDDTKVTDAGLAELQGLEKLQHLHLNGTRVTDAGLKELKGLKKLQELDVSRTKVTDAGMQARFGLDSHLRQWQAR